jgi:hypothetical protein
MLYASLYFEASGKSDCSSLRGSQLRDSSWGGRNNPRFAVEHPPDVVDDGSHQVGETLLLNLSERSRGGGAGRRL